MTKCNCFHCSRVRASKKSDTHWSGYPKAHLRTVAKALKAITEIPNVKFKKPKNAIKCGLFDTDGNLYSIASTEYEAGREALRAKRHDNVDLIYAEVRITCRSQPVQSTHKDNIKLLDSLFEPLPLCDTERNKLLKRKRRHVK